MLLMLLLEIVLLGMLETGNVLEMRAGERRRGSRLERAAEKQLGWEQRSELHVEGRARSGQVGAVGVVLLHRLRVDGRDVASPGVPVRKARNVGRESTMGEARVAVGRLRGMAVATGSTRPWLLTIHVLHPEKMRRDKTVPGNVR